MVDIVVVLAGLATIAWVNWYFFFAGGSSVQVTQVEGVQEVRIRVRGGYEPAEVRVRMGTRVRLLFDRQESSGSSEEIVFPAFGIRRFLPPKQETAIELLPEKPGRYEFTCGKGMLRGRLIVDGGEGG